jgi:hypothetical protein
MARGNTTLHHSIFTQSKVYHYLAISPRAINSSYFVRLYTSHSQNKQIRSAKVSKLLHPIANMGPITPPPLQQIPLSYASCSIGCGPSDTLPRRLEAIGRAGFTAIELSFADILDYGEHLLGHAIRPNDYNELTSVAREIRTLCKANGLSVMMLQPFANFEGWPKDSPERKDAFERAAGWIEIMKVVGTDILQVDIIPFVRDGIILY